MLKNENSISLEKLPSLIQETIFQYVQASDLLVISLLSRSLYEEAVSRLYNSITITDSLQYELPEDLVDTWTVNRGTLVPFKRVEKLAGTLSSPGSQTKLRRFVHTLTLHHKKNMKEKSIFKVLANTPNLQQFHNFSKLQIPPEISEKLRIVTCVLGGFLKPAANLQELRIRDYDGEYFDEEFFLTDIDYSDHADYSENFDDSEEEEDEEGEDNYFEIFINDNITSPTSSPASQYTQLGKALVESGAYTSLRKLHISSGQFIGGQDADGQFSTSKYSESWVSLFDELLSRNVKLNLHSLALHGVEDGKGEAIAKKIASCVNLSELKQLVLANSRDEHHEPDASFLELLTRKTNSLESLAVYVSSAYSAVELDTLHKILTHHIPHQLKDLTVSMAHEDCLQDRCDIEHTLVESQNNLVRLRIEDEETLLSNSSHTDVDLDLIFDFMQEDWGDDFQRQQLFPEVIANVHSKPIVSDSNASIIRGRLKKLSKVVKDNEIFISAPTKFPFLTQYYFGGVFFDVKTPGVFINENIIPFEEEGSCEMASDEESSEELSEEEMVRYHGNMAPPMMALLYDLICDDLEGVHYS